MAEKQRKEIAKYKKPDPKKSKPPIRASAAKLKPPPRKEVELESETKENVSEEIPTKVDPTPAPVETINNEFPPNPTILPELNPLRPQTSDSTHRLRFEVENTMNEIAMTQN